MNGWMWIVYKKGEILAGWFEAIGGLLASLFTKLRNFLSPRHQKREAGMNTEDTVGVLHVVNSFCDPGEGITKEKIKDIKGFVCVCGTYVDYPVQILWNGGLFWPYRCSCGCEYLLYMGLAHLTKRKPNKKKPVKT